MHFLSPISILFPLLIFFKSKCLSPKTFFRLISVHSFAFLRYARPWCCSGDYTPHSLREGHGVILGHFMWYYWWWIKSNWHRILLGKPKSLSRWPFTQRKYPTRNGQRQNPVTKSLKTEMRLTANRDTACEIWGSHSGITEDAGLLTCATVGTGRVVTTFRRIMGPSSSGPRRILLGPPDT
jgi:hypothetical protein